MTFDEQVRQELKMLSIKQRVTFAWRCSIRSLPILGDRRYFNFLHKEDIQKHLLSIFSAQDVSILFAVKGRYAYSAYSSNIANDAAYTAKRINVVAYYTAVAAAAAHNAYIAYAAANAATVNPANAATVNPANAAAAYAYYTTAHEDDYYDDYDDIDNAAIYDTAYATDYADAAYAAANSVIEYADYSAEYAIDYAAAINIKLKEAVLQDIRDIKADRSPQIFISTYGKVWEFFQKLLKNNGCEY